MSSPTAKGRREESLSTYRTEGTDPSTKGKSRGGYSALARERKGRDSPGLGPTAHQGCHGEADDLKVAIIMPLGLEVMVLPGVAPGHGACTVPKGGQQMGCGMESAGWDTGPTGAAVLTWGYSERRCTAVSGPESWGLGPFHHTAHRKRECWGHTNPGDRDLPPPGPPMGVNQHSSPLLGCAWLNPWSCPSGSQRRLSVEDRGCVIIS